MQYRCPYCHKVIDRHERYCYFCDQDLSKVVDEKERPKLKK